MTSTLTAQTRAAQDPVSVWRERIGRAREARRPFEPAFLSNLAFASGQHWLVYDRRQNRMRHLAEVDPRYAGRELYTADRITEYREAQLGELSSDDDRPELLTAQIGDEAAQTVAELNQATSYAWEHEWQADEALRTARRYCVDLGVAALRCRWNPNLGPTVGHAPMQGDEPVTDPVVIQHLAQHGQMPDGSLPRFKPVREGRTVWEPYTAFMLFTPPGINHENGFPWEILGRPVPIDDLVAEYGSRAAGLTEDGDISSAIGLTVGQQNATGNAAGYGRLRDHVWLYTCFQRPTPRLPDGQVVVIASNRHVLLDQTDQLEYRLPNGQPHTGVVYLHFRRRTDRFWSGSFIENLKDPQRIVNRRATQNLEIIDRGMPRHYIQKGDLPEMPSGAPMEVVELKTGAQPPAFFAGAGPGAWMYEDLAQHIDNLSHASTMSPLRLGENPPSVNTYSQLALLNENEAIKRALMILEHRAAIGVLTELSVGDIVRYWPDTKKILVSGEGDEIREAAFRKQTIPTFFMAKVAKGAPQPRSQAAELTKIDAIWAAAAQTGVVAGPNGQQWAEWYANSLDAGHALDLPAQERSTQADLAHYENELMTERGQLPVPDDHDLAPIHVPIHREALDRARASGDVEAEQRLRQHIALTIQSAATARKMWRLPDPADTQDMASDLALDEDQALRENQMMVNGQPLNPEAFQQAYTSLQRGVNPETGQPVTPGTDLHGILLRASLKPTLTENLELHMDRHAKVIKSQMFETFPPDVRERFLSHFDQTRDLFLSLPMLPQQVQPPHVTLSLRESVGPTTIAEVLRRAGVPEADPGTIASEPPMENTVSVMERLDGVAPDPGVTPAAAENSQEPVGHPIL